LNDALFHSAFTGGKRHIYIAAAAFSLALLVSTSRVVHAANKASPSSPPAGQEINQKPSTGLPVGKLSQPSAVNPQIELLSSVIASEQTAAMQEAGLIQQRAEDAWVKAMPQGMNPRALIVNPDNPSRMQTVIEFSIAPYAHVSDIVLVHASGQVSLDRSAWGALTQMDPPPTVPGLPSRNLRYRITFAYDNPVAEQTKVGPQLATSGEKERPTRNSIQEPSNSVKALPQPTYNVGGPVAAPELVWAPDPVFPNGQEKRGVVEITCIIDVNGQPKQVIVVRHLAEVFDKNAVDAVKQYRFKPAMLQGKPVPVQVNIQVNFQPF
jgi:TonB family protein